MKSNDSRVPVLLTSPVLTIYVAWLAACFVIEGTSGRDAAIVFTQGCGFGFVVWFILEWARRFYMKLKEVEQNTNEWPRN